MGNGRVRLRLRIRALRLRLCDPKIYNTFSTEHIPPANPSAGPNRLSFYVPFQATRLSLGQGNAGYKTDTGIVGTTEEHIGWEVKTGEIPPPPDEHDDPGGGHDPAPPEQHDPAGGGTDHGGGH